MLAESVLSIPCLVFALRRESMYFRSAYPLRQHFSGAPCRAQFRRAQRVHASPIEATVLMLETGIGPAAMESALNWCLDEPHLGDLAYRPSCLISVGFSGALQPGQRVGDLVLATEVIDQQGKCWPAILPTTWAVDVISTGRLLTMPRLVSDPQEKHRLGRQYDALAVDMESAVAARLCHQHNVPFACLRVISDDWQTPLSAHLIELLRHERVSFTRLAGKVLRHPKLMSELWHLARNTRLASQRLQCSLSAILSNDLE